MRKALTLDHVQVAMPRGQEAAARDFYGRVLGLVEIPKPEPLASRGGVWFRCGTQQFHLGVEEDFRPAKKAHPAFYVHDLESLTRELEAAGYPVVVDAVQPEGGRRISRRTPLAIGWSSLIESVRHEPAMGRRTD